MSNPAPTVERLLTYKQVGNLLGLTPRSIWTLVRRGDLPAVRFGRSVRIAPADLATFIATHRTGGVK